MSTKAQQMPDGKNGEAEAQDTPYWSSALSSIGIWNGSKVKTSPPGQEATEEANRSKGKASTDHLVTPFHGQSFKSYPEDCPRLKVQWFHAVDVSKRSTVPSFATKDAAEAKLQTKPKKFSAFTSQDSRRIESQYQKLLEAGEALRGKAQSEAAEAAMAAANTRVPVNEDFLFDVSIESRELCPVYWLGPVYEVRRGTWFFQDGSNLRPCEENLAAQLEEGYIKLKAWIQPEKPETKNPEADSSKKAQEDTAKSTHAKKPLAASDAPTADPEARPAKLKAHRLFGTYMNNTVTYEDANTAWLVSDGVLSWVATSVYERFAGGGHMSGVKLIRGYSDLSKNKEKGADEKPKTNATKSGHPESQAQQKAEETNVASSSKASTTQSELNGKALLQRRLSTIIESEDRRTANSEDEVQKLNEEEMRHNYHTQSGESQNREIEHLVLVTHGIGQRLSLRTQSVNFIHDVNVMRKTIKAVYANSPDLRSMNTDEGDGPGNCRVQVLPVCWRHKVDFPRGRHKESKDETDLAEAHNEEEAYPSLEDITIDGVAFARSLISDLALDVLLYQSSYKEEISRTVIEESNRIVDLFRQRNPEFKGKIHVIGHSLGSAILFDILCHENRLRRRESAPNPLRFLPNQGRVGIETNNTLDFDVEDFYCLGSPIGLFQMLTGSTIAARQNERSTSKAGAARAVGSDLDDGYIPDTEPERGVSRPDATQLFNIFYPSDPISYRLEPLIAPSMASMKPHNLPYTKKGLFGVVGPQGLTGIGTRVGQSVSGLFASLSTGISSNLLPASLRITNEEAQLMMKEDQKEGQEALETGTKEKRRITDTSTNANDNLRDVDDGPELPASTQFATLYSRFQMSDEKSEEPVESQEPEGKGRESQKQRMARRKVWALNRNGRVDFSIQEGALDFNPISTIASHIGYWAEEDVSHFMLSQVLSHADKKDKNKAGEKI